MRVWISGVGISAAGIPDWDSAKAIITGEQEFEASAYCYRTPEILGGAERRRCPASVKLALDVAEQARAMAGVAGADMAAVFGSMTSDGPVIGRSLATLTDNPHYLSPTDFHNSVHNVAIGYWAMATGSRHGSTSLAAADDSCAASLLKAAMQALSGDAPVMLCVYDVPFPPPLDRQVGIQAPFGAALVLHGKPPANSLASMELVLEDGEVAPNRPVMEFWSALFAANPAARFIPLAEQLALLRPGAEAVVGVGVVGMSTLTATLAR